MEDRNSAILTTGFTLDAQAETAAIKSFIHDADESFSLPKRFLTPLVRWLVKLTVIVLKACAFYVPGRSIAYPLALSALVIHATDLALGMFVVKTFAAYRECEEWFFIYASLSLWMISSQLVRELVAKDAYGDMSRNVTPSQYEKTIDYLFSKLQSRTGCTFVILGLLLVRFPARLIAYQNHTLLLVETCVEEAGALIVYGIGFVAAWSGFYKYPRPSSQEITAR